MQGRAGTAGLTRAGLQLSAAVGVHAAAAGCLPGARGLALALPAGLLALLLLDRVLAGRPLASLAAGQLTAHAVLTAAAACTAHATTHAGTHVAAAGSHVPMTLGHVVALVLCRAVLDRAVLLAERAAELVLGLARRVLLVLAPVAVPVLPRLAAPAPAVPVGRTATGRACVRGPPRRVLLPVS